jgi:hypothetical protein
MAKRVKDQTSWTDRRGHGRAHVLWNGRIRAGGKERSCVILDLSASGAMLRLPDPEASRAHVTIEGEHFKALPGRVVWQQDNVVGLRFSVPPRQVVRAIVNRRARTSVRLAILASLRARLRARQGVDECLHRHLGMIRPKSSTFQVRQFVEP